MFGSLRRVSLQKLFMFCGLILILALTSQSPAQQCASLTGIEDFDHYNQPARDVQIEGDYAYTADTFGMTNLDSGHAKVKVLSGSAVMVYASVVDNITNDPTTIPVAIIAD